MSILLPDHGYIDHAVIPLEWGGPISGALGGPDQILHRLGDRFALRLTTPPLRSASDARIMFQRLMRARKEGALACLPQNGVKIGAPGSPVVDGAVAGGTTVPMRGLTPHYVIREGQPFSVIHSSRRYVHYSDAQVIADASGLADVVVTPLLRVSLSDGDVVELGKPMIEGALEGDPATWEKAAHGSLPFNFTIREMR